MYYVNVLKLLLIEKYLAQAKKIELYNMEKYSVYSLFVKNCQKKIV